MNTLPFYVAIGIGCLASGVSLGQVPAEISACASVTDDKSRLKCYDEHMARAGYPVAVPAASARAHAPMTVQPPAAAPKNAAAPSAVSASPSPQESAAAGSASDDFGLEGDALRKKREADSPAPASAKPKRWWGA